MLRTIKSLTLDQIRSSAKRVKMKANTDLNSKPGKIIIRSTLLAFLAKTRLSIPIGIFNIKIKIKDTEKK